jgi:hypothetical protein
MSKGHPALFVVSIDLEMSWGAIHHGQPHENHPYSKERQIVREVLSLMDSVRGLEIVRSPGAEGFCIRKAV